MKIAFLCLAHNNFDYIELLANYCETEQSKFYLHIDRRAVPDDASLPPKLKKFCLEGAERLETRWGTISLVKATLNLIQRAYHSGDFDTFVLISGSDLPLVKIEDIKYTIEPDTNYFSVWDSIDTLKERKNNEYNHYFKYHNYNYSLSNIGEAQNLGKLRLKLALAIRKILYLIPLYNKFSYRYIYKGSQWWALSKGTIKHILSDSTPSRIKEFSNVHAPDEVFFQSLVLNSKTATSKNLISESQFNNKQGVHYIDWGDDKTSKRLRYFYLQSRSDALKIGCIFARKIDFSNVKEYKEHIRNLLDK